MFKAALLLLGIAVAGARGGTAYRGEYFGFVLITYEDGNGRTLGMMVSGPVFYCEGARSQIDGLQNDAEKEESFKATSGYWNRPLQTALKRVQFLGGNTTRQAAQRDIDSWIRLGAKTYRSDLEGPRYWDPATCKL